MIIKVHDPEQLNVYLLLRGVNKHDEVIEMNLSTSALISPLIPWLSETEPPPVQCYEELWTERKQLQLVSGPGPRGSDTQPATLHADHRSVSRGRPNSSVILPDYDQCVEHYCANLWPGLVSASRDQKQFHSPKWFPQNHLNSCQ